MYRVDVVGASTRKMLPGARVIRFLVDAVRGWMLPAFMGRMVQGASGDLDQVV